METQEKSFRDLQQDERVKKLERHLKLTQIKRPNNSQLTSSPRMSVSGISSIHGDNPLSDLSFCSPSVTSSRSGSVILASSLNFRKKLSRNVQSNLKIGPATSSVFDQRLGTQKTDEDRTMMPPPQSVNSHRTHLPSNVAEKGQAVNSTTKMSTPESYDNQNRNVHSPHKAPQPESSAVPIVNKALQGVLRNNETPKQNGRIFKKWIVRLNDHGQIIIRGRLESGEQARSKAVKGRVSATTVLSVLNHKYHLVGDIHDVREELPEYVRGKFFNGFPMDWENVRQIWQSYVASDYSLQFRWPRPMADSDDDLISDITDLTVARVKKPTTKPPSVALASRLRQAARKVDKSSRKNESRSKCEAAENNSDISLIHSMETENSIAQAKPSVLETSCRSTLQMKSVAQNNNSDNDPPTGSSFVTRTVQTNDMESKHGNMVPKWKVDIIIDNLMNKNCSKEYIDKIIRAIDCFNELLTMPATNDSETVPDRAASLNFNSNGCINTTNNKNRSVISEAETSKNVDNSRLQNNRKATASLSNSFSLESSAESDEKSPPRESTFVCEQTVTSRRNNPASHMSMESHKSRNSAFEPEKCPNYPDISENERTDSALVKLTTKYDTRHVKNKENQDVSQSIKWSREKIVEKSTETGQRKRQSIFGSEDSETDARASSKTRTVLTGNSLTPATDSRQTLGSEPQPIAMKKMNEGNVEDGALHDSNISILNTCAVPNKKPKVLSIENREDDLSKLNYRRRMLRSDFSFTHSEQHDHSRASSPVPKKNGNLNNEKVPGTLAAPVVDECIVRLNNIPTDQCNPTRSSYTPSRSKKAASRHLKSEIDGSCRMNEPPASDPENLSMRMSSRGRRIMPALDYWNGERVILKGLDLVYSPGTCHTESLSANSITLQQSLMSPNKTPVSEPTLPPAKNLNKTPTGNLDCSKTAVESTKRRARGNGGILSEISGNHDTNIDHAATSNKRTTRTSMHNTKIDVKKNWKSKSVTENPESSSEDEKINSVRNRKKRRIY